MSKSIRNFISLFVVLQFVVLYPTFASTETPWESNELIGTQLYFKSDSRMDPQTQTEEFYFIDNRNVACTMSSGGAIAPCLGFWNIDSSGTVTVTDCCAETIKLSKIRSRGSKGSMGRDIEVMRNGEMRVYQQSKRPSEITLYVTLIVILAVLIIGIVGLVWVIKRWRKNREKRILQEKETSASS